MAETETRQFKIDFYQAQFGPDGEGGQAWELLQGLAGGEAPLPAIDVRGTYYQIRELIATGPGVIRGVFGKIRHDDIPHIGSVEGEERDIELAENEGLIEKNHFLFFKKWRLVVWQQNGHAANIDRFGAYLTDFSEETISLNPVFQPDAMKRLLQGENQLRRLELSIAKPTNAELYVARDKTPDDDLIALLADSGAFKIRLDLAANGHSRDPRQRYLPSRMKAVMKRVMGRDDVEVKRATVQVEDEHGLSHPIDLIADRLRSTQDVSMLGRYPDPADMFRALRAARDENLDMLKELFGEGDQQLA